MRVSVIIPTLNEAANIIRAVGSVTCGGSGSEVIVVDGGSTDNTVELAGYCGVEVVSSPPGRARQMNAGAGMASGDALVFLHADTLLPENFHVRVVETLERPGVVAGAFKLAIDSPDPSLRLIERLANWRSRVFGMPYGDQAIFVRAEAFREAGGFPEMPVMEDFELMRRLRRLGGVEIAPERVLTSARRWERLGVLRFTLINQAIIAGYYMGVPPDKLASWRGAANARA